MTNFVLLFLFFCFEKEIIYFKKFDSFSNLNLPKKVSLMSTFSVFNVSEELETDFFLPNKDKKIKNELGKKLFLSNCNVCHIGGTNVIIPEKNLKFEALETNGMNNLNAIIYQILNGKNGMPAFGGRLNDKEIESIAEYILEQSVTNLI
jgi:cytochrome c6